MTTPRPEDDHGSRAPTAADGGGSRPHRVVVVAGTGTEVGKTWMGAALLREWRGRGLSVAARKPAQSFEAPTMAGDRYGASRPSATDAEELAGASGEEPAAVCPPSRWFPVALAPPMAADALGRPPFTLDDLVADLGWPALPVSLGLVELAGGVRSPLAADGDGVDLVAALRPDAVILVAASGLGTINAVRLSAAALEPARGGPGPGDQWPLLVVLNRFDPNDDLHRRNRKWLAERDGFSVSVAPAEVPPLAAAIAGLPAGRLSDGR